MHIRQSAFTLIELLVVISIIVVLMAILVPAVMLVQNRAHIAATREQVTSLSLAMRAYADEDPRHFFPTPKTASEDLVYDLGNASSVVMLLERAGYAVNSSMVDNLGGSPTRCLMDAWWRPLHYRLDGPFVKAGGTLDTAAMNGTADKPAAQSDWNAKGVEPFAYVWSLGRPKLGDTADALPANAVNWIYQQSTP